MPRRDREIKNGLPLSVEVPLSSLHVVPLEGCPVSALGIVFDFEKGEVVCTRGVKIVEYTGGLPVSAAPFCLK